MIEQGLVDGTSKTTDWDDNKQLPVGIDGATESGNRRPRHANREFLERRQKQLRENPTALSWLEKGGVQPTTIRAFHLGLSGVYIDRKGLSHSRALVAPVIDPHGIPLNYTVYLNIPGITTNPASDNQWMKGAARTYYAGAVEDRKTVFVCERLKDLWLTWQALHSFKVDREILLISSTHGSPIPDEWRDPAFWDQFKVVYLGYDNDKAGEEIASHVSQTAGHETLRARPPGRTGKSWGAFWQSGGTLIEFQAILAGGTIISEQFVECSESGIKFGRHEYKPIDIATAFHHGHLYYPVRTLRACLQT